MKPCLLILKCKRIIINDILADGICSGSDSKCVDCGKNIVKICKNKQCCASFINKLTFFIDSQRRDLENMDYKDSF